MPTLTVNLRQPHKHQAAFINSPAKRKVIRAGRRGGKTVGIAIYAVELFLAGKRILYATPTQEQIDAFWSEVKRALDEPLGAGVYYKNETRHIIEPANNPDSHQRIRAKTAWDADSLRGDFADVLILDEYQLIDPDAWDKVGAPMLLDNNGDAVFIFTKRRGIAGQHADDLLNKARKDTTGRWAAFTFSSHENPHISKEALHEIVGDMTDLAYRMEILAEDVEDDPDALWNRAALERTRVTAAPDLARVVVAVDPPASSGQCGIVVVGSAFVDGQPHGYVIADHTTKPGAKPEEWAAAVVTAYHLHKAGKIVGEVNNGGDMIESVIRTAPNGRHVNYGTVRATRGKAVRAEPVSALWGERSGRGHIVGVHQALEDQLCMWIPGVSDSPDRLDAMVWGFAELNIGSSGPIKTEANPFWS